MSTALSLLTSCNTPATTQQPSFSIPVGDLTEFAGLPEARRVEVQYKLQVLRRLHDLRGPGSLVKAAATIAAQCRHQMRGASKSSLLRAYYLYMGSGGDWRVLVSAYKAPSSQPSEFVAELKRVAELNNRSIEEAFNQVREQWAAGEPVKGYGTWVEYYASLYPERPLPKAFPRGFYPTGWSIRNLRRYGPSKASRVLFQQGLKAAKSHFPSITRDPSGLRPLELVVIDDFVLDCLCVFPGDAKNPPQVAPVAGLLCKDVGTRRNLVWGLGAQLERVEKLPNGATRKVRCGIRRVDVQMLLNDLFRKYGLPDYTVTILCENATASIAPELELALTTLFDGRVRIERTGLINHRSLTNGFTERGGCPWEKGWIESAFNSLWNIMGSLPGYKGSNARLNGPADIDRKIDYTKLLIGQGERALNLSPEQIMQLRLPFPSPVMLERAFAWACAVQDARTDHKYLGFDRVTEFLLSEGDEPRPFSDLALLPPSAQQQVQLVERSEAPLERWGRLAQGVQFSPIPPSVLALLLLTPKRVSYKANSVSFVHEGIGYTYVDQSGAVLRDCADGAEFLAYFDAGAPEQLHLATLTGAYAGSLTRLGGRRGMIDIRDKEALSAAGAVVAEIVNRTKSELRERHADMDAQLLQDRQHNQTIVDQHRAAQAAALPQAEQIAQAAITAAASTERKRSIEKSLAKAQGLDATKIF